MTEVLERLDKISHLSKKIDGMLLFPGDSNFFYFTNSSAEAFYFYDFNSGIIFTSSMEYSRAKRSWADDVVQIEKTADILSRLKGSIGLNMSNVTMKSFEKLKGNAKFVDISADLQDARAVKTNYEAALVRKACKMTGKILETTSRKGTESGIKAQIEYSMARMGVEPAFKTIVAAGKNIETPHHIPTEKKVSSHCLIDLGIRYKGYCSDVTRTTGSKYEKLLDKIISEITNIKPGEPARNLDIKARKMMGSHSKSFITSLGHGIGIDVHEKPYISEHSSDILSEGMIFTIEPGIYKSGGLRIENDYIITKDGCINLTDF